MPPFRGLVEFRLRAVHAAGDLQETSVQGRRLTVGAQAVEGLPTHCSIGPAFIGKQRANAQRCEAAGLVLRVPRPGLCTDNGAMVAALGSQLVAHGATASRLDIPADPSLSITTVLL